MIRGKISLLSKPFRKARARFNKRISGVKDTEPRWRICTSLTNDNMGVPIGTLYIKDYFKEIIRNKVRYFNPSLAFFTTQIIICHHLTYTVVTRCSVKTTTKRYFQNVSYPVFSFAHLTTFTILRHHPQFVKLYTLYTILTEAK